MTHILLNIKYKQREPILTIDKIGEKLIRDWTIYNEHHLVKDPIMYNFPSVYVKNNIQYSFDYNGYTGLGLLSESHISIHTYPEKNIIHIDFFSCKQLNQDKNIDFIEKTLEKDKSIIFDVTFINRELQ